MQMKTSDEHFAGEHIEAETLAAIVAAAAVFMGRSVAIHSVNLISGSGKNLSRWTRQSRNVTNASHNLTHPPPAHGRR
jgi:hypothetical protein